MMIIIVIIIIITMIIIVIILIIIIITMIIMIIIIIIKIVIIIKLPLCCRWSQLRQQNESNDCSCKLFLLSCSSNDPHDNPPLKTHPD